MDSRSHRGQKCRRVRLVECLLVVFVFGECCTGIFGRRNNCPSTSIADLTNGTGLQIVNRRNQTKDEYCGASLETICFRDLEKDNCWTLLNLSLNLVAEDKYCDSSSDHLAEPSMIAYCDTDSKLMARGRLVKSLDFSLLQTQPSAGKHWESSCNVAGLAKDRNSSDKVRGVNMWLDYDCCAAGHSRHMYAALLSVSYGKNKSCKSHATVRLNKDASSTVKTVTPISSENSSADSPVLLESKEVPNNEAASLVGVVAAVVIAVVGAIVTIVLVYIVCVKCSDGRFFNNRTTSSQSEHAPLQPEKPKCHICHMEKVKANVVAPEEADSISYATIDLNLIPTIIFASSDEDLTEEKIDSGCFESSILTDMQD